MEPTSGGFLGALGKALAPLFADVKHPGLLFFTAVGALGSLPYSKNLGRFGMFTSYIAGVAGSYALSEAAIEANWIAPEFVGVCGFAAGLVSMNVIAGIWVISNQFRKDPLGIAQKLLDIITRTRR